VYNQGSGILENCDSQRCMIHYVAGYVTCIYIGHMCTEVQYLNGLLQSLQGWCWGNAFLLKIL
jgi:hypothetical protein